MRPDRLTVALDATPALVGHTGVTRYVLQLTKHLVDTDLAIHPYAIGRGDGELPPHTRRVPVPLRVMHEAWRRVHWPGVRTFAGACDVVHATDLLPPPSRVPVVLTIHDLAAVDHPSLHPPRAVAIQRLQLERARDVDVVIAVSRATAEGVARGGVEAERIVVVHEGTSALGAPDLARVPPVPYFLCVGSINARKGFEVAVEAFAAAQLSGCRLVLAGPPGFGAERVLAAIETSPARDSIMQLGRVTDAELAGLYQQCTAVLVPSWAEGFGFIVLEACAAGAPVIASDIEVLREVGGDAPRYVGAGDAAGFAHAMRTLATDQEQRDEMARRGPAQAAHFSWRTCADETAAVYRRAAER